MTLMSPRVPARAALIACTLAACLITASPSAQQSLPTGPLVIRAFTLHLDPAGTFTLSGDGWPSMAGTWSHERPRVTFQLKNGPADCSGAGRYTFSVAGERVGFALVADACTVRRMILDRSEWSPPGVQAAIEPRRIVRRAGTAKRALPPPATAPATGHRSAGTKRPASPMDNGCLTTGTQPPARMSCGGGRFPASRTPAPSSGVTCSS